MYNRSNQRINYFKYLTREKLQTKESPFYFAYGRTALKEGLKLWKVQPGKKILVPNYICVEVVQAFLQMGLGIQYFSMNEDLSPDWNSVKEKLTKDTWAILMVHYFGIAQDISSFIKFANGNNLLLIEDNSHGYGGLYEDQLMGTFGDIGIA